MNCRFRPLFSIVALSLSASLCASAQSPGSLLPNPKLDFSKEGTPTFGFWIGNSVVSTASGADKAKSAYTLKKADGVTTATIVSRTPAPNTVFGVYVKPDKLATIKPGQLVRAGALVRGKLTEPPPGGRSPVNMTVTLNGKAAGMNTLVVPAKLTNPAEFDWTPVEVIFPMPENTAELRAMATFAQGVGEIEWRNFDITPAPPGSAVTPNLKIDAKFPTAEEAFAAVMQKFAADMAERRARFKIPAPDQIYQPKPALSGPHPRYFFGGDKAAVAALKEKLNDPKLAKYRDDLFAQARKYAADNLLKPPTIDVEDPMRDYADRLPWIALAYLMTDNEADKKAYLDGVVKYLNNVPAWGVPPRDLPLSQMIFGVGAAYDWLNDVLPADSKAKARDFLVAMAREMRRPRAASEQIGPWQWRSQTQWLANHKWYNYAALAMAASVLWGEDTAPAVAGLGDPANIAAYNPTGPLQKGEPKVWMDEAMEIFYVVEKSFGHDGAPIEGYNYNDYGLRPFFDFAILADQLTTCKIPLLTNDWMKNHGAHRLASLLPNHGGFYAYADSTTRQWGGSIFYRGIATRFNDGVPQLLADIMEGSAGMQGAASDNYDQKLPDYKTVLAEAQSKGMKAASGAPIFFEAESMTAPPDFTRPDNKMGAKGQALSGATVGKIEKEFEVPESGLYALYTKYAEDGDNARVLLIDGKIPFREASYIVFGTTGGWSNQKNQFRTFAIGEDDPEFKAPYLFALTKGKHTLTIDNPVGGGINWDWFAFVPEGMTKESLLAKIQDTDSGIGAPPKESPIANWRGAFWYNPKLASAKIEDQPLFHASEDLGIFTARSSWTDPKATWFGFKCGKPAGNTVAEIFGDNQTSGHTHPDAGSFLFYAGSNPIIVSPQYAHEKFTTNHSLAVSEATAKDAKFPLVGQYGEGAAWFANNQKGIQSHPTVLDFKNTPNYHTYLAEIGGVYKDAGYPSYRRSITYLPAGAVVVVDKIESPKPETWHFRLPTVARDMKVDGKGFACTVGVVPVKIVDFSPTPVEYKVTSEIMPSFNNPTGDAPARNVASLIAKQTNKAIFATVIGVNGAEKGISVKADDKAIQILGAPGGTINLDWKPEKKPDVPKDLVNKA
jgi:hypothetical protein